MNVKGNHPLAEAMAKKLSGIEIVPKGEIRKMVQGAINIAVDKYTQLEQDYTIMESACNYWLSIAQAEISRLRGIIEQGECEDGGCGHCQICRQKQQLKEGGV